MIKTIFIAACIVIVAAATGCGSGDDNACAKKLYNSPSMVVSGNNIYISYYAKNKYTDTAASTCTESSKNYDLIYSVSNDGGNSWTKKTVVTELLPPSGVIGLSTQNIAVNSTGSNIYISYIDGSTLKCAYSTDSGSTFTSVTVDSSYSTSNQSMIINGSGTLYIAYNAYLPTAAINTSVLNVATSSNSGATWTTATADGTANTGFSPSLAVDSTNCVHITYYYPEPTGGIRYATNTSGSWATLDVKTNDGTMSGLFNSIVVPPGNTAYASYYNPGGYTLGSAGEYLENTNGTIEFAKSVGPVTYTSVDSTASTGKAVSADISGNNIYISYGYYDSAASKNELRFAKSTNGGSSFTVSSTTIDTDIATTTSTSGVVYLSSCLRVYTLNSVATVYVVYVTSSGTALKFAKSTDGGTLGPKRH